MTISKQINRRRSAKADSGLPATILWRLSTRDEMQRLLLGVMRHHLTVRVLLADVSISQCRPREGLVTPQPLVQQQ